MHTLALFGGGLALLVAMSVTPCATADPIPQTVRTQSGNTRCELHSDSVRCEYGPGFSQAPVDSGRHWDQATVTSGGKFGWDNANMPGTPQALARDVVLNYGQLYHLQGWTISPAEDGTRFTSDGTGHGMFVSIDNVYAF